MILNFFSRKNWNQKTIDSIFELIPNIEQISTNSTLINMNVEHVESTLEKPLLLEAKLALLSFKLGANLHAITNFYDLTKLNQEGKFRLAMCIILYPEVKDKKINHEHEWQLIATEYDQAWRERFKVFMELGYIFYQEFSEDVCTDKVPAITLATKLIEQINQQTHILLSNGSVEER